MKTAASRKLRNFLECGGSTPLFSYRIAKPVEETPVPTEGGVKPPQSKKSRRLEI
jgi:hypothetical protein